MRTIGKCVDNAIENGNHQAFVEFFFRSGMVKFYKEFFLEEYRSLIANAPELKNQQIYKSKYWRDPNCIGKKAVIEDYQEMYCENICIEKWWYDGDALVPGKDELVQIGLCKSWGVDEVNKLLIASGQQQLYPLDIVDAVGMFYLECLKNDDRPYDEKIAVVKNEINNKLIDIGNRKLNSSPQKVGYFGEQTINDEIKYLINEYNIADKVVGDVKDTVIITKYVNDNLKTAVENKEFESFFDSVKDLVAKKQYGYLRRTLQYIESFEKYKKNLYYPGYVFSAKLNAKEIKNMIDNGQVHKIWKGGDKVKAIGEKISWLNEIWKIKDILTETVPDVKGGGGRMVIKDLIEGRQEKKELDRDEEKVYTIKNDNILHLYKFAIAAGREDELGEYLIRSGYREENLNDVINEAKNIYTEKYWEVTESIFVYCMCLRDRLIDEWASKMSNSTVSKQYIKNKFPLIQLIMEVNGELQRTEEYKTIENIPVKWRNWKEIYVTKKTNRLMYPIGG